MTVTAYDAVTPSNIPADAEMVMYYKDGLYAWSAADLARFPKAFKQSITWTAQVDANILDVERGDAAPGDAPGWAKQRRAAGEIPIVYCNTSTWPTVVAAFAAQHEPLPLWWAANYSLTEIPEGAIALQFKTNGYDTSIVGPDWPGLNPAPIPTPVPKEDDDMKCGIQQYPAKTGGQWLISVVNGELVRSPIHTTPAVLSLETMGAVATNFDEVTLAAMPVVA